MNRVSYKKYKNYSGFMIVGERYNWLPNQKPFKNSLFERAFWLTSYIETNNKFGTVQSYDGCGMSAGLEHNIAVYPKDLNKQGPLINYLETFWENIPFNENFNNLLKEFNKSNWFFVEGKLLDRDGNLVSGQEIRNVFTPNNGVVPVTGKEHEEAKKWIILFHKLFLDTETHVHQIEHGIKAFENLSKIEKETFERLFPEEKKYSLLSIDNKNINEELDLALCFYFSYSVNAPAITHKIIKDIKTNDQKEWARIFLAKLKNYQYGNWNKRWLRTKNVVLESDLWSDKTKQLLLSI